MRQTFDIALDHIAVLYKDGLPVDTLEPGRHRLWGARHTIELFDLRRLVFEAPRAVREVIPVEWFRTITLSSEQRGVIRVDGRVRQFLAPGVTRVWALDPTVEIRVYEVSEPLLDLDVLSVAPAGETLRVIVQEHQRGLLYIQGRFERVLEPGHHLMWNPPSQGATVRVVDMRRKQVTVAGQELMTRDKVTLRLSLTADYRPLDPAVSAHVIANPEQAVYSTVQLAVREFVAGVTLDELLEGRDAMTRFLEAQTAQEVERFGVKLEQVGVKDVVLPGEMKTLLNRVIEAEKQAAAQVILRREEAAETRAMANAAKLMEERPALMRLKELEAFKEIATGIDEVKVVVGGDAVAKLLPREQF